MREENGGDATALIRPLTIALSWSDADVKSPSCDYQVYKRNSAKP
jgi:hypothetical protein